MNFEMVMQIFQMRSKNDGAQIFNLKSDFREAVSEAILPGPLRNFQDMRKKYWSKFDIK